MTTKHDLLVDPPTLAVFQAIELLRETVEKPLIEQEALHTLNYFYDTEPLKWWQVEAFTAPEDGSTPFGTIRLTPTVQSPSKDNYETLARKLLEVIDDGFLTRVYETVYFAGTIDGVTVSATLHDVFCERVEVGFKEVEKIDPDYLADAPKTIVQEPVYEYRCSDDIMGMYQK